MTTRIDEEIEGLGDEEATSWDGYPIDTLLIRNEQRTVYDVWRRIEQGTYVMNPDFQRDFIWSEVKQSKLIESVIMRIPLPVFYLAEDDQGRMVVVDGLQRLSTFHRFVNNELKLRLPNRCDLNGKRFKDLSSKLQNRIEDCNLIIYSIDAKVPERARLDIFERVNGGEPLTRQQMRNCLYMGAATQFLKAEAKTDLFLQTTGKSLKTSTMRDREFVNRFCAFQILDLDEYRDMDEFLANGLRKMNAEEESLPALSEQFKITLHNNFYLFEKHAFRKHERGQEQRNVLNASLWDVMSTGLSHYPRQVVEERSTEVREGLYRLLKDDGFVDSITRGPNGMNQVKRRFAMAKTMLEGVFDAY